MNWEKLRSPAVATFKDPKISLWIGNNLEVRLRPTLKNPNFTSMDEFGEIISTVENKMGNLHKIRLLTFQM